MPEVTEKKNTEIIPNDALPVIFIDNIGVGKRGDGMFFIQLATNLPDGLKEQVRIAVSEPRLSKILDLLCQVCGHYPVKPKGKTETKEK